MPKKEMKIIAVAVTTFLWAGGAIAQETPTIAPATTAAAPTRSMGIKAGSRTAATLEIAMPLGTVTYGLLTENQKLLRSGVEVACSKLLSIMLSEAYKRLADRNNTGVTYADYVYKYPSYAATSSSRQLTCAFATATSVSLRYKKWYVAVPAYTCAGTVACTRMIAGKECLGNVLGSSLIGAASGLAAHWLTKKILPVKERREVAGL